MATKQQKLLEDTSAKVSEATSLIGEVADNAKSAVSELEKIASGNSDVLDSNKSVLKKLNVGVILITRFRNFIFQREICTICAS